MTRNRTLGCVSIWIRKFAQPVRRTVTWESLPNFATSLAAAAGLLIAYTR